MGFARTPLLAAALEDSPLDMVCGKGRLCWRGRSYAFDATRLTRAGMLTSVITCPLYSSLALSHRPRLKFDETSSPKGLPPQKHNTGSGACLRPSDLHLVVSHVRPNPESDLHSDCQFLECQMSRPATALKLLAHCHSSSKASHEMIEASTSMHSPDASMH